MKKIFALITVSVMCAAMFAQGEWAITTTQADELLEQEAGTVYMYDDPAMGTMVVWDWDVFQFRICSTKQLSIISGWGQYVGTYSGVKMLVGIYNDDGTLVEKFTMWLDTEKDRGYRFVRTRDAGGMSNPVGQKKKVRKVFEALRTPGRYVRFVCGRYDNTNFDLKVPALNTETLRVKN